VCKATALTLSYAQQLSLFIRSGNAHQRRDVGRRCWASSGNSVPSRIDRREEGHVERHAADLNVEDFLSCRHGMLSSMRISPAHVDPRLNGKDSTQSTRCTCHFAKFDE